MMMARPTAASAAATVMTKNTKTCPATPYVCANATNVRFTALSISSTHMKMMIAFRRVSTPMTPIVNSAAERKSDSASTDVPPAAEGDGADDGHEQHDGSQLEGEQVVLEQRLGDRAHRVALEQRALGEVGRHRELLRIVDAQLRADERQHREAEDAG